MLTLSLLLTCVLFHQSDYNVLSSVSPSTQKCMSVPTTVSVYNLTVFHHSKRKYNVTFLYKIQSLCKSLIYHISKFLWEEDKTDELHGTVPTVMMTAVIKRKQAVVTVCHRQWSTLH